MAPTGFSIPLPFLLFLILLFFSVVVVQSQVPKNQTFRIVNEGEFGEYIIEYDASYRIISTDQNSFYTYPFRLCFYNTTPNAHIFAIRAGIPNDEDLMRWVWDANRNNPVRENATLTFGRDGNLVLADVDGRIAWQTNTANKGVTGISMEPNGNLVLHDKRGRFIWQSFHYPADTLLVGQSLLNNGRNKLVSRTSDVDGRDGPYSIVVDKKGFTMYVKNSGNKLLQYGGWGGEGLLNVTFTAVPEDQSITAYELTLGFTQLESNTPTSRHLLQSRPVSNSRGIILKKINYNATYSFMRLESDGNLRIFTYYTNTTYLKWAQTYAFFGDDVRECGLPSKCGSFGFCDKKMCIACPSPKGLLGWSKSCMAPPTTGCKSGGGAAAKYYKIVGVEHFTSPYDDGEGPIKVNDCKDKCSKDCNCVGFFYKEESSKCLRVPLLGTLIKDVNASHVGFIKYLK